MQVFTIGHPPIDRPILSIHYICLSYNFSYTTAMKTAKNQKIDKIGKYEIIRVLGEGSFGKVYLGSIDGEQSALKCIPKKSPRNTHNEIRNLRAQTQLLSKLTHDNIIAMKQFFETSDEVVVVMEYAGDDLAKLLEKERRLPEDRVRYIGKQILSAMLYLHENRILHRDLKPQNILMQGEQIKLCDFGFAKKMSASTNFLSSVKGTPLYIAPQILQNKHYTHKVDVWSFGIILYELAYGRTPFHSTSIQQLQPKILHEPVKFPRDMSANLRELIDGMLQKSDQKRYDWNQVKNHPFFTSTSAVAKPIPVEQKLIEKEEKIQVVKPIKWIAEEECAYLKRIESDLQEGKVSLVDLKFDQQFCIRVIQFIGQVCIDRSKVTRETLLLLLQRIVKISRIKDQKQNQDKDFTRNKQIMTAIITLAIDEQDDELLMTQLELIGFLLQQNFDKVKIDTDHDDQITTLISAKLTSKSCPKSINNCLKVLGILTSQALVTLSNSEEYFQRLAEEKLISVVAECYTPAPESAIILEVLEKFIHPRYERSSGLNHRLRALFRGFKEEVAPILLKNGLIGQESPISRNWKSFNHDLELYCQTVYELLRVSKEARTEFLKHNYWKDLLSNSRTKIYFLAMIQAVLKGSGVFELSIDVIQNEIVIESTGNKLISVFLIYFTPQHFNQQVSKASSALKKMEKLKLTILKIEEFLKTDQNLKSKWCKELLGYFNEEGRFFDDLLIETLYNLVRDCKEQQVLNVARQVIEGALQLPLSQQSLILCLQMMERQGKSWGPVQLKKLDDYFVELAKKEAFDDFLSVNPSQCAKLLTKLLKVQCTRIEEDNFPQQFAEILQKTQLLRLLFSQQLINEQLLLSVLKIINKIISKLTSIDFLGHGGFQTVKKFFKTNVEDLKLQIIIFCSHLARVSPQYCNELLQNGIISICFRALNDEKELLIQKTLHLIGNLSKHNDRAYEQFEKYQIVCCILKCISQFHKNKKILKNTIYSIGNIAFHREEFVEHIKEIIKYLLEGLDNDDNHLLLNTISTISNLLRHSSRHLQPLIDHGVFSRLIQIYGTTTNPDHISYINNVLRKALKFSQIYKVYPKQNLKKLVEINVKRGLSKESDNNVRNLRTLLS